MITFLIIGVGLFVALLLYWIVFVLMTKQKRKTSLMDGGRSTSRRPVDDEYEPAWSLQTDDHGYSYRRVPRVPFALNQSLSDPPADCGCVSETAIQIVEDDPQLSDCVPLSMDAEDSLAVQETEVDEAPALDLAPDSGGGGDIDTPLTPSDSGGGGVVDASPSYSDSGGGGSIDTSYSSSDSGGGDVSSSSSDS